MQWSFSILANTEEKQDILCLAWMWMWITLPSGISSLSAHKLSQQPTICISGIVFKYVGIPWSLFRFFLFVLFVATTSLQYSYTLPFTINTLQIFNTHFRYLKQVIYSPLLLSLTPKNHIPDILTQILKISKFPHKQIYSATYLF